MRMNNNRNNHNDPLDSIRKLEEIRKEIEEKEKELQRFLDSQKEEAELTKKQETFKEKNTDYLKNISVKTISELEEEVKEIKVIDDNTKETNKLDETINKHNKDEIDDIREDYNKLLNEIENEKEREELNNKSNDIKEDKKDDSTIVKKEKEILNNITDKSKSFFDNIKHKTTKLIKSIKSNKLIEKLEDKEKEYKDLERASDTKKEKTISKVVLVVASVFVVCCLFGFGFFIYLLQGKPEFDVNQLKSDNSTIIYDANGNEIIELGLYLRENVEYEDIPTSLVDAFCSVEDNRYFTHIGFDIPRFTRVLLKGLTSGGFSQGGSTITMQLIKNSYFQVDNDTESTMAARSGFEGLSRKAQEIVLAIQANSALSKEEIITLFLNKINFGNNIRGVQKAAQYYFGKDVSEINLAESAFLAGIINGPNSYNPYNELYKSSTGEATVSNEVEYLQNAQNRKDEVLATMLRNGYITKTECELAQSIKIEDMLSGVSDKFKNYRQYYQSYIDAVIDEVIDVTGKDPYTTSMSIYTNMDAHMQEYVYNIQNQNIEGLQYTSPNEQSAIVLLNNQDGSVIALGGGTNQNEARQFNRATSAYIQPGSSIKTVLEYALAFNELGWATSHTICDKPIYLYNSDILIVNAGGQEFTGDMLITEAIARSLNSPAIQALEQVIEKKDEQFVVDYMNAIGFKVDKEDFDLQFAIGGNRLTCTPLQLAGAHAMLMNLGKYVKPHTINKIVYTNGKTPDYVADTEGTQVISPGAAWLTAYCEQYNVEGEFYNLMQNLRSDYPVFAKTGTTDWGTSGLDYGIPTGSIKDAWLVAQTNKYTMSIWLGFDKLEKGSYFTVSEDLYNLKGKIGRALLDELEEHFDYNPGEYEMPDDVVEITHVKGAYPYAEGGEYEKVTGFVTKANSELVDVYTIEKEEKIGALAGMQATRRPEGALDVYWAGFGSYSDGKQDISAVSANGKVTAAVGRCYFQRYNYINPETFYGEIRVGGAPVSSFSSNNPSYRHYYDAAWGDSADVCGWTSSDPEVKCAPIDPTIVE